MSDYISFEYTSHRGQTGTLNLLATGKSFRLHHKDISFINLSEIGQLEELQSLELQSNRLEYIDLSEIARCRNLRSLNLSDNRLTEIDLDSLRRCDHLESLFISRNWLEYVDISPLKGMKGLTSVSFAENNLQSIDLFPLAHCENLRTLNLLGNLLHEVNLAPILMCFHLQRVELSGNPSIRGTFEEGSADHPFSAILIDALVKNAWQYGKPEWLKKADLIYDIEKSHFSELIERLDWKEVHMKIGYILRRSTQAHWFDSQKASLESFQMSELIGLDATFRNILLKLPKLCDYEEGRNILYERIVDMIRMQIANKGSTHFFDVDKMSTKGASVLIPDILDRRREEIEETVLAIHNDKVYLRPLWKTGYGFEILKRLGMRDTTDRLGLGTLEEMFTSLGMTLRYRVVQHWPFGERAVQLSPRMEVLLDNMVGLPIMSTP